MMLPFELAATGEEAGAFHDENCGDEPKIFGFKSRGEAAEEDYGGPDEG